MNNFFIAKPPFQTKRIPNIITFVNKAIKKVGYNYALKPLLNPYVAMNSIEQRSNYYLLINALITSNIEGEMIEIGTFEGQCAMLFQKSIEDHGSDKVLQVYDNFESKFSIEGSIENKLKDNFNNAGLKQPVIHKGYFDETIPSQLPQKLSFVHIDCGFGGDKFEHKKIVLHCLEHIYPRLTKGAVCALMDYHDDELVPQGIGYNPNPGVKLACDEFLLSRPEKVVSLYANEFSHGFFRKI